MNCPHCRKDATRLLMALAAPEGIRRKRECLACGNVWSTIETVCHDGNPSVARRFDQGVCCD